MFCKQGNCLVKLQNLKMNFEDLEEIKIQEMIEDGLFEFDDEEEKGESGDDAEDGDDAEGVDEL